MGAVRTDGADIILRVAVQPRAAHTEVAGMLGDSVRVRLAAPPLDGRANSLLVEFLASEFGVPRSRVELLRGGKSRHKILRIVGPAIEPPWLAIDRPDAAAADSRQATVNRRPGRARRP